MSSIPLWVPLVVAGLGVAGSAAAGIAGSALTQRRADRRELQAWERERERERERWAREDEAQTFEHRREAYIDFYTSVQSMARAAYDKCMGLIEDNGNTEPDDDWGKETLGKLHLLEFYADRKVTAAAYEAFSAAWSWGSNGKFDEPHNTDNAEREERYGNAEQEMLRLMRDRLSIPEGDMERPRLDSIEHADRPVVESD